MCSNSPAYRGPPDMHISSLAFTGFGPYRKEQTIDFDLLGDSGLYLINGLTGAGKSTIIDAICFALFGKLANDDSDPSRMRSHFCGPKDPTRVELVFESAEGRFRVERSPEYLRAKAKGDGQTKAHAACKLHRIASNGSEETIATQVASANDQLSEIIGLTRDQFVQTVVLPQGKFATFLNADTREREEVLKKIFDTYLYERIITNLKDRSKAVDQKNRELTEFLLIRVRDLSEELNIEPERFQRLEHLAKNSLDVELLALIDEAEPKLQESYSQSQMAHDAANDVFVAADRVLTLAREERQAVERLAAASEAEQESRSSVDGARLDLARHSAAIDGLSFTLDESTEVGTWRDRAQQCATILGQLDEISQDELEIAAWPATEEALRVQFAEIQSRLGELSIRQEQIPARIEAAEQVVAQRPTGHDYATLQTRVDALTAVERAERDLAKQRERRAVLDDAIRQAVEDIDRADRAAAAATRAYRAGIAGHLAAELVPGEPCAVCGSMDHPAPAQQGQDSVDYEEVERLRSVLGDKEQVLAGHATTREACEEEIARLEPLVTLSPAELTHQRQVLDTETATLEERETDAAAASAQLGELRNEQQDLTTEISTLTNQSTGIEQDITTRAQQIEQKRQRVESSRRAFVSVTARREAIASLSRALTDFADRLQVQREASVALEGAQKTRSTLLDRDGFADVEDAEMKRTIADEARLEAAERRQKAKNSLESFIRRRDDISDLCKGRADLLTNNRDLMHLTEIFATNRGSDFGLHIYVLRTLFGTVMELANQRLESLLNGRYRLVSSDASEGDLRRLQGLGVSVHDALTGKTRPAKSLSGGETFCASLALALGLSDAVRMNAGGVRIGSLFIDEGFGSLDNEQLDDVMNMLNQLSSGGRRVGLISHVDSMKETITERIDVHAVSAESPTSLFVTWMQ